MARHSTDSLQSKRSHRLQREKGWGVGGAGAGREKTEQNRHREKEKRETWCEFHLPCMACSGRIISLQHFLHLTGQSRCPLWDHARGSVTGASVTGWSYTASTVTEPMREYPCAFHATAGSFLLSFQHWAFWTCRALIHTYELGLV